MAEVKQNKKPRNLTVKQTKFVKGIAEGKPGYKAVEDAYDVSDYSTASSIASENLKKPDIRQAIDKELSKQGLTMETIVRPVKSALMSENLEEQLKGHDRAVKLWQIAYSEDKQTGGNTFIFNNGQSSQNFLKK